MSTTTPFRLTRQGLRIVSHPAVRLAVSGLLLALLLLRVDLDSALRAVLQLDLGLFAVALAGFFLVRLLNARQVQVGLQATPMSFSLSELFRISLMATFLSLLLPGYLLAGGVVWYRLARPGRQVFEAGALLVYLRLLNTLTLLAVGLVALGVAAPPQAQPLRLLSALALAAVLLALLPFLSSRVTGIIERAVARTRLGARVPPLLADAMRKGWAAIRSYQAYAQPWFLIRLLALSLLAHGVGVINLYLLARAVNLELSLPVLAWVRTILNLVQMLPITYAGLGVREVTLVLLLDQVGVPETQALALSLAIFALATAGSILAGAITIQDIASTRSQPATQSRTPTPEPADDPA